MKVFRDLDPSRVEDLINFAIEVSDKVIGTIEEIVCRAYLPKAVTLNELKGTRWHLFRKHPDAIALLPPTMGALVQHIYRAFI